MNLLAWVLGQHEVEACKEDPPMPEDGRQEILADQNAESNRREIQNLQDAETLIFVDADGVVNVGIRDTPGQSPLLLCETNLNRCRQRAVCTGPSHIIKSAAEKDVGHGDDGTYSKFATVAGSSDICEVFAERLAGIIRVAGPRCRTILSSSWRKPSHHSRVVALEAAISKYGGKSFKFDDRTRLGGDEPEKRIQLIGDFIREHTKNRSSSAGALRVVVLEDFAATHPRQWKFGINSKDSTEEYWRCSSSQPEKAFVKLVHCYEEWLTDQGMLVQIGSGLTCAKVCEAELFLTGGRPAGHRQL
mmetsp:Transcript_7499/g.12043  ORF Transcript_7499/g.12043 Transcript_7499/m.12043 type:complete len:303 (-) Transcript_7499:68-976(-)